LYQSGCDHIIAAGEDAAIAPKSFCIALLLSLVAATAHAAELFGTVVAVADGDTVTLLDASRQQHRIRLSGIDAPERRQAYGERSKQHLAAIVFQKRARVVWDKRDRYGRIVGRVFAAECERGDCPYSVDAGVEQIRAGLAWHYKQYQRDQTPLERARYAALEEEARARGEGLWKDSQPVAPWNFRRHAATPLTPES
jgi:endonuclease YncB( thermonuclease family)